VVWNLEGEISAAFEVAGATETAAALNADEMSMLAIQDHLSKS
jgi:hypothetical protein